MRFENRRWLVIPIEKIDDINFSEVIEPNAESLRKSVDGTKTFIKYTILEHKTDHVETFINAETGEEETNTIAAGVYGRPSVYSDEYIEYNHADILALLATEEWTNPIEE